jgi:hypothetical protein
MTSITLDCPHPLSPPALAKILWHSGMKSNNTCNSLTHAVITSYLKEIVGTLGLGLGPKKFITVTIKLAIGSKRHDVGLIESVDGFWMKQRLCTIVSPYI